MATNMNTYERKPINEIKMPYDAIKAYDTSTEFKVELYSKDEKVKINDIAFFIMSQNDDEFTSVTNYSVKDGTVTFTIPKIKEGKYYPQIMDNTGRVFSSDTNTFIDVVYNSESRALEVFPIIKDQIIKELTPQIKQYVMDNADIFMGNSGIVGHKGDKGDQGVQGKRGFKGNRGKKGEQGIQGIQGVQGERGFTGNRGKKGEQGVQGEKGDKGDKGDKGLSPYEIALNEGYKGSESEWLESLKPSKEVTTFIPNQLGEIILPDDFINRINFKIFNHGKYYSHDFNINNHNKGKNSVYVSSEGTSVSDGLTPETPVSKLLRAFEIANDLDDDTVEILIMDRLFHRDLHGFNNDDDPFTFNKNIIIKPYQFEKCFIGTFEDPSRLIWTENDGYYSATRTSGGKVLDFSGESDPIVYSEKNSLSEMMEEEGSYFKEGDIYHVNTVNNRTPDGDITILVSILFPTIRTHNKKLVIDSIGFFNWRGTTNQNSLTVQGNSESELIIYKSTFSCSNANGISTINLKNVLNIECTSYENMTDGFNYHTINSENPYSFVYEFNVKSFNQGYNGLGNNNASTGHEGLYILRIGGLYYNTDGPVIADVNGCYSIIIGAVAHTSTRNVKSGLKSAIYFSNNGALRQGKAYVIDSSGGGYDTYSLSSDGNVIVYVDRFMGNDIWPLLKNNLIYINSFIDGI